MTMLLTLAALLSLGAPQQPSEAAVDARLSATYKACMEGSGGVTSNMLDCTRLEYDRQDDELNAAYRTLIAHLDADDRVDLRKAQRAWVRAKEARCDSVAADMGGGTASSIARSDCLLQRTVERVLWLEDRATQ